MTAASVTIEGYPEPFYFTCFQASETEPGTIVAVGPVEANYNIDAMPRITTINASTRFWSGSWPDVRLVKPGKVGYGFMRLVFQDSRWKMKYSYMSENHNDRDSAGMLKSGSKKTVAELIAILAEASGLTINTGELPTYSPPAKWAGLRCDEAMQNLLDATGVRLVYDPVQATYTAVLAGDGDLPDIRKAMYRPGPPSPVKNVTFYSDPIIYESEVDCRAVTIDNESGETVDQEPEGTFGFSGDQTAFRLWEPIDVTYPAGVGVEDVLFLPNRAKSHINDPTYPLMESPKIQIGNLDKFPSHRRLRRPKDKIVNTIETSAGGRLFVTDHPLLAREGDVLSIDAKLTIGYYAKDADGSLMTQTSEVDIDTDKDAEITVKLPWIRPVDSDSGDVGADKWQALLDQAAASIARKYMGAPQTARLSAPISTQGSGRIGAVHYIIHTGRRAKVQFLLAFDYSPTKAAGIR